MLEFQKLEKLEFGGIKGKILSEQVCRMNEEFLESCEVFRKRTYDPSDYSNMVVLHPAHKHLCCYFLVYLKVSVNLVVVKLGIL